ncbi:hypothetical protein Egran_03803 [Elaphomyces granulatus]|uniref:ATP-dependent DNA helicase n=1 Tax=Elaphomyces granulatus TaxID=519963 RepID=A0A232LWA3_9EURO|nr:hypothetical protein Egran_03803 [Elaphomyces granulatus]
MTFVFGDNGDGSEDTVRQGLSPLEKYKRRDEELGDVTYLKFLLRFNIQSASNIYELRPGTPSSGVEDLKLVGSIAGQPWGTFKEAYTHCESNHHREDDHYDAWMEMAGHLPQRDGTDVEDPNALGERDLDRGYDWDFWVARHPGLLSDFWKTNHPTTLDGVHSSATVEGLEEKQRQLYDLIIGHYERLRHGTEDPGHLQINLDGKVGTGKSHVIMFISSRGWLATWAWENAPCVVPLPCRVIEDRLSNEGLAAVQATFRGVSHLIIDEKSMIGLHQLAAIDRRCRDIFPDKRDKPFGRLNIVLAGNFFQLPAVAQKPLFWDGVPRNDLDMQGQLRYRGFDTTIELDVVRRQEGTDPAALRFMEVLDHLHDDAVTIEDIDARRCAPDTTYTFAKLGDLNRPVLKINALHHGPRAEHASTEDAGNLEANLLLSIGCRIMLLEDLWTEHGLVNGAFGTVLWQEGDGEARHRAPFALLVKFDLSMAVFNITARDFTPGLTYVAISRLSTVCCLRSLLISTLSAALQVTSRG